MPSTETVGCSNVLCDIRLGACEATASLVMKRSTNVLVYAFK